MKTININSKKLGLLKCLVDDEDYNKIVSYGNWTLDKDGYAIKTIKCPTTKSGYTTVKMHRLIMNFPKSMFVDHIDNNKLNNQKGNLRIANVNQNHWNRHFSCGKSKYKGVGFAEHIKKWRARITVYRKEYFIGHFDNEIDAARAYDKKAIEFFGEYAKLNFPVGGNNGTKD